MMAELVTEESGSGEMRLGFWRWDMEFTEANSGFIEIGKQKLRDFRGSRLDISFCSSIISNM